MEIKEASAMEVTVKIPWKHLQTEAVVVTVGTLSLTLVEPEEELELEELPAVFRKKPQKATKKSSSGTSTPKKP